MQYVMANILWLKLRYIGYIQVAPFHLFWLNFLFLTWLCHHHHHLHHHNHHGDQEKHNIMYKKSRANGSQAGGLPDCTEVTDWPSTRTTIEISLILRSHSHLRKEKPLVFLSFCIVTGTCSHFRNLFPFDILETFSCKICPHTRYWRSPQARRGWELSQMKIISTSNTKGTCCPKVNLHRTM